MYKSLFKKNKPLNIIYNSLINLSTPINISMWWNFGSLLGLMLMFQIISGLFLSMHYCPNTNMAFNSIIHIIKDVNFGWMFRLSHMNGASMYFLCIYLHIGRGLYFSSYNNLIKPWIIGVMIYIMSMATAFMGYILPWGQMSFWGATVITNLISTIPYIGQMMVEWIWGGFSVSNPTLNRFFTFHFVLPFIILAMVIIHLMFIHEFGSNNPLGMKSTLYMIPFNIYFTLKDIYGFILLFLMLFFMIMINPYILNDPENFLLANPMITPIHIQPEWYFLFAYTILRSIPNKLGGVISLLMSILILMIISMFKLNKMQSMKFYPINQFMFWMFINNILILTWLGSQPIEKPFMSISQIYTILYFSYFFFNQYMYNIWDNMNL